MSLADIVEKFEGIFKEVRLKVEHDKNVPLVWSGGLTGLTAHPPVLYSDPDHAISSWNTWALASYNEALAKDHNVLEWIQRPELVEYQITIADKIGRHRAVNNRWAVKSQFQVISD